MSHSIRGYIGTYASPESGGIYQFTFDPETGGLSRPELFYAAPDSKYLSLYRGLLAAPVRREAGAGVCLIDTAGIRPQDIPVLPPGFPPQDISVPAPGIPAWESITEEVPSCYVTQDDRFLYTANYHEGTVLIYEKRGNSLSLVTTIENGRGAGCHQVLLHGRFLLVFCLLKDRIRFFDREQNFAPAGELPFPTGTGPRHGVFDREHRRFFAVSELSNQIFVYEVKEAKSEKTEKEEIAEITKNKEIVGNKEIVENVENAGARFLLKNCYEIFENGGGQDGAGNSLFGNPLSGRHPLSDRNPLSVQTPPASAAIRLSPDEDHLYVSTRFADIISVYSVTGTSLTGIQQTGSGGEGPRDFVLTEDGRFLIAVNRTKGGLVCFPIDPRDGTLLPACAQMPVSEGVAVVLEEHTNQQPVKSAHTGGI